MAKKDVVTKFGLPAFPQKTALRVSPNRPKPAPAKLTAAAEAIATRFGLRPKRTAWRGNCPKCAALDTLTLSRPAAGDQALHAWCRSCDATAAIFLDESKTF